MNVLQEADKLIHGDRLEDYGDPRETYQKALDMFKAYADIHLNIKEFMMLMTFVKIARQEHLPKRDNVVDALGYLTLAYRDEVTKDNG